MKRLILASLLTVATLVSGLQAQGDKPTPKPEPKKPTRSKYVTVGKVQGELTYLDTPRRTFKIRITSVTKELNRSAYQSLIRAQQNLARAQQRRDVNGIRSAQNSIAQNQRNLYTIKKVTKDYTIEPVEDFEVRRSKPGTKVDDMGNFVELTKQEIAKLRGKDGFFDGKWEDLEQGQTILIQVVRLRKPEKGVVPKPDVVLADKVVIP